MATARRELDAGHADAARREFDAALTTLLTTDADAPRDARIDEAVARLVDQISTIEARTFAEGDGFTAQRSEPASIDELLAMSATMVPATPNADLEAVVAADLARGVHDLPIPVNARVLSFVELFQTRLHDFLQAGLDRSAVHVPMIQQRFRTAGLPLDLAYVPLVESAFKTTAFSTAKARGLWQFMTATGRENGLYVDWFIDERADPEKSTAAAARYLASLVKAFDGDWHLALASYNVGPGRIDRVMRRSRRDDYWALTEKPGLLPRETRDYVPMLLAAMLIARDPARYGFVPPAPAVVSYDTVSLTRPVDLRRIAEWTETPVAVLQALNPELRRWTTPVRATTYAIKVPAGTAEAVRTRLETTPVEELATLRYYAVRRGDTLATVARRLRVSRADLAAANDLRPTARVTPGQPLLIPLEAPTARLARDEVPPSHQSAADPARRTGTSARRTAARRPAPVTYRVKAGDTLTSIARAHATTVANLRAWNKLGTRPIRPGDRLTIRSNAN